MKPRNRVFLVSLLVAVAFWWGLDFWQTFSVYPMTRSVGEGDSERFIVFTAKKWGPHRNQMHGAFTEYWWPGGPKSIEGFFVNGREDGDWVYYDERGRVLKKEYYDQGVLIRGR